MGGRPDEAVVHRRKGHIGEPFTGVVQVGLVEIETDQPPGCRSLTHGLRKCLAVPAAADGAVDGDLARCGPEQLEHLREEHRRMSMGHVHGRIVLTPRLGDGLSHRTVMVLVTGR